MLSFSNLLLDQIPFDRLLPSLRCSHQLGAARDKLIATLPLTPIWCGPKGPFPVPRNLRGIARPDALLASKRDHLDNNDGLLSLDNDVLLYLFFILETFWYSCVVSTSLYLGVPLTNFCSYLMDINIIILSYYFS